MRLASRLSKQAFSQRAGNGRSLVRPPACISSIRPSWPRTWGAKRRPMAPSCSEVFPCKGNPGLDPRTGVGPLVAFWNLDKPVLLEIPHTGSVLATVTGIKEAAALAGIKLGLSAGPEDGRSRQQESGVYYTSQALTGTDGTCTFDKVLSGKCMLYLFLSDKLPYYSTHKYGLD